MSYLSGLLTSENESRIINTFRPIFIRFCLIRVFWNTYEYDRSTDISYFSFRPGNFLIILIKLWILLPYYMRKKRRNNARIQSFVWIKQILLFNCMKNTSWRFLFELTLSDVPNHFSREQCTCRMLCIQIFQNWICS